MWKLTLIPYANCMENRPPNMDRAAIAGFLATARKNTSHRLQSHSSIVTVTVAMWLNPIVFGLSPGNHPSVKTR